MPAPPPSDASALRRLLGLAKTEWRNIALGCVCLAIGSATTLAFPQALRFILDEALGRRDPSVVDKAALAMVVVLAIQAAAGSMRYVLFTVAGERIVTRLREDVYRAILRQEIAFFDARTTGELTSRLASDTTVLQNTVSVNVSMALRNAVTVIGGIGALVWTSPKLTAVMLLVVPPVAVGRRALRSSRSHALARGAGRARVARARSPRRRIGGMRTVRSFAAEAAEVARYGHAVERSFQLARVRAITGGVFVGAASLGAFTAAAAVLWYGGHLVLDGAMSVGQLTSFFVYTLVVAFSLAAVSDVWADFMKASGAGARIFELLDRTSPMTSAGERPESARGAVTFEDVSFRYPARPDAQVLSHVSLVAEPGRGGRARRLVRAPASPRSRRCSRVSTIPSRGASSSTVAI